MIVTLRGVGLTTGGVALLATGFTFGYPELAILGATAVLAQLHALAYAALRPRLSVTRAVDPDRVARGEGSTVTLTVRNTGRFGAATLVAHDRCGPAHRPATVPVPLLRLRPGRDTDVSYPVPTDRRGVVEVGPLQVTRRDPLGLVSVSRSHGETARIWVYPRSHLMRAVPAGISRSLDGRLDRVPHGAITFDTLREYVIGDELRHVHWRTSAKVGELMVREHLDTSLPRLVVLLDDRAASWADRGLDGSAAFESACEAAASIVSAATREDLPITMHLVSGPAAGGSRIRGASRDLLDLLAEAELRDAPTGPPADTDGRTPDEPLVTATNRLRQHRPGDTLIYLTGTAGLGDLALVSGLKGSFPSVALGVLGPRTADEPQPAGVLLLRAEDGADFAAVWDGVTRW
ncbi:hypothetical protein CS0771_31060 [Catellatospora sp. IY07-71]|uniref:DUF58 domain-containing protein n=1 Tax=Catellatospora sp. IY07-71 TaxID=2728827 RepID=UPI001BB30B0D|nr:DUF58 domain-containing protein [Catellatospora sp. IY07-71]BCJ73562.1 hypothetical protein CS0771_31060 [Catellatospora sp. IY07-71]